MSKPLVIFLKSTCWLAIGGFALASVTMHRFFADAARPDSGIWCANSITEPLGAILSLGTPFGVAAAVQLGVLWHLRLAAAWSAVLASLLVLVRTALLLVDGIQFFRASLPGFHLSAIVWWIRPVGGLFGV